MLIGIFGIIIFIGIFGIIMLIGIIWDYLGLFFWDDIPNMGPGYVIDVLDVIGIMGIYCGWLRNPASPKGWLKS